MDLKIFYHGTNDIEVANNIVVNGFNELTYFADNLADSIHMGGGKYVFSVIFDADETPNYWQIRPENRISPKRILALNKYDVKNMFHLEEVGKMFDGRSKFERKPYVFKEDGSLNELFESTKISKTSKKIKLCGIGDVIKGEAEPLNCNHPADKLIWVDADKTVLYCECGVEVAI